MTAPRNPCTCAFIRHPMPHERGQLESEKTVAEAVAVQHPQWSVRQAAKVEAARLYVILHSECITVHAERPPETA